MKSNFRELILKMVPLLGFIATVIAMIQTFKAITNTSVIKNYNTEVIKHIENLDDVSNSLSDVQKFITESKELLKKEQERINSAKIERDRLQELNRLDTQGNFILKQIEEQNNKRVVFSFFTGVLASLVAAFLYSYLKKIEFK